MNRRTLPLEFATLLARAVEDGRVVADPQRPADDVVVLRSVPGGRRYEVRWAWWYGADDVTIDRQAASVVADGVRCDFASGTAGMAAVYRLLAATTEGWREHFDWIGRGCLRSAADLTEEEGMDMPTAETPRADPTLVVARAIREASARGRLRWRRVTAPADREEYAADFDGRTYLIEIFRPQIQEGGETIGPAVARLSVIGAILSFAAGTEGMELIREALAASLPERAAALAAEREALEAECRFLLGSREDDEP